MKIRSFIKKCISLLFALTVAAAACGCQATEKVSETAFSDNIQQTIETEASASDREADAPGNAVQLKIGTGKSLRNLTPFETKVAGEIAEEAIYEKLGILDRPGGELVGVLAKNWKTIDDGTTWDVEIYDYIYDSMGNHITAEDVSFCYNKRIGIAQMTKCLACEAIDEYTVRITLNSNGLGTLNAVMNGVDIVSMKAYEASADGMANDPVGTGPYIVEEFVPGSYITLGKNPSYWQTDDELKSYCARATVDKLSIIEISGANEQRDALESGAIDCMDTIIPSAAGAFEGIAEYTVREIVPRQFFMMNFSGDESSTTANDIALRMAIAFGIDSYDLVEKVLDGRGQIVKYLGMPAFSDSPTEPEHYFSYDPNLAKELLSQSYYEGQTIRIVCQNLESYPAVAEEIAAQLELIGIHTEVISYESHIWFRIYNDPTQYDLAVTEIGAFDYLTEAWQTPFSTSQDTGRSKAGWNDERLKVLIEEVRHEETHTREKLDELQNLVNENMYALGLMYRYSYSIWNNNTGIINVPQGCRSEMLWWCSEFE